MNDFSMQMSIRKRRRFRFGFVKYESMEEAWKAIRRFNGLKVRWFFTSEESKIPKKICLAHKVDG